MLDGMETRKDTVQVAVEAAFKHVGQIAGIITGAGREVTRELGDWATEMFEMRDAARQARLDREAAERFAAVERERYAVIDPADER